MTRKLEDGLRELIEPTPLSKANPWSMLRL
jgi:hypothetical protein